MPIGVMHGASHYGSEQYKHENLLKAINEIVLQLVNQLEPVGTNPELKKTYEKLREYSKGRMKGQHNPQNTTLRLSFIKDLLDAALYQNDEKQKSLLEERSIEGFKGVFSQQLYNIAKEYRDELNKPSQKSSDPSPS